MKIEQEIRFYFADSQLKELAEKLKSFYAYKYSYHEITAMYDNPNPELTFYSKEIDGRLRLRYSNVVKSPDFGDTINNEDAPGSKCLVTWKRRLPQYKGDDIRREEEIEYSVSADEYESVKGIFESVLKCKRISSYERIRSFLSADGVQITCDKFPYGVMLELELEDGGDDTLIARELNRLGLNPKNASKLSCDDMYFKLCEENGIEPLADIAFDDLTMPKIGAN